MPRIYSPIEAGVSRNTITRTASKGETLTLPMWHQVFRIPSPLNTDSFPLIYFPAAATLTRVHGERSGGTSVTFNLGERAEGSYFAAGTNVFASDEVLTANETWIAFSNASMAANSLLFYDCTSLSGSVTDLIITLEGTWD